MGEHFSKIEQYTFAGEFRKYWMEPLDYTLDIAHLIYRSRFVRTTGNLQIRIE